MVVVAEADEEVVVDTVEAVVADTVDPVPTLTEVVAVVVSRAACHVVRLISHILTSFNLGLRSKGYGGGYGGGGGGSRW